MGANCAGCVNNGPKNRQFHDYAVEPSDISDYCPTKRPNLPELKFQGLLSNIKIYNCPQESISLKFIIQDILECLLPRKIKTQDNNQIKWKTKEKFEFILNEYELRKRFLYIESSDERGKIMSSMKINLYHISTGPYHHDFKFKLGKAEPRLQFDLKISQFIQTKVTFDKVEMHLNKKYFEAESLYFNVRLLRAQDQSAFQSNSSYTETLILEQPSNFQREIFCGDIDECQSPIRFKAKKLFTPENTRITWNTTVAEMPEFKIYMKSYDIRDSLLYLAIWKIGQKETATLFSYLHIPAYKLYTEDPEEHEEKNQKNRKHRDSLDQYQNRSITISDKTMSGSGEDIGEIKLKMHVENSKYIKQMKACARTEKGIIPMVPLLHSYGVNYQEKKDKLTAVRDLVSEIEKINMEINHCSDQQHITQIRKTMLRHFQTLRATLEASLEQSYAILRSGEQEQKNIQDQIFFLSIVEKIEVFLEDDEAFKDICWHIILAIIKRGQFSLPNIGFKKKQIDDLGKEKISPLMKKKIKIGLEYQEILYRLFWLSLKLGYIEGREKPKPAIEIFKAYCYFRIPIFRDILLKMVVRKDDDSVEWKTDNYDADLQYIKETQDVLVFELDWQLNFYKPLSTENKSQILNKQLMDNLQGNIWLSQVSKRGSTFFYFLHFLVKRLLQLGRKIKFIKWQYFPGYNKLVKSFLYEMKKLRVISYPKSLLQTSINLLSNEKLINIFMITVFEKTNAFDCNELMKGLQIMNRYLKFLTREKKLLPPTFNYVYFYKGLKNILQGEFSYAIMKTLGLIFTNYQNFNVEFRKTVSLYLLGKVFFKLFLNWSFSVRSFFYHLLVLKISRSTDIFNSESRKQFSNRHELMNEITSKYQHVIKLVRNANTVRKEEESVNKFRRQEKDTFKSMKKKLYQKKKIDRPPSNTKPHRKSFDCKKINLFDAEERVEADKICQEKYSIDQLNKMNNFQRSYSAVIDANYVKLLAKKVKNMGKDSQTKDEENQIEIHRIKSSTNAEEHADEWKDTNTKTTEKRKRRMSFFAEDDFQVQEIKTQEVEYLPLAIKQFDELDQAIRKYKIENGELPTCDLQGFQIPYDEDIRPSTVAIDQWQPMTNILE